MFESQEEDYEQDSHYGSAGLDFARTCGRSGPEGIVNLSEDRGK
jgi:hypothetical protein